MFVSLPIRTDYTTKENQFININSIVRVRPLPERYHNDKSNSSNTCIVEVSLGSTYKELFIAMNYQDTSKKINNAYHYNQ